MGVGVVKKFYGGCDGSEVILVLFDVKWGMRK